MITTCGMMVSALATASGLLFFRQDIDEDLFAFGCMACIGMYLIAFSSGAGAIPWFLAGELVPVEVIYFSVLHLPRIVHNVSSIVSQRGVRTVDRRGLPLHLRLCLHLWLLRQRHHSRRDPPRLLWRQCPSSLPGRRTSSRDEGHHRGPDSRALRGRTGRQQRRFN